MYIPPISKIKLPKRRKNKKTNEDKSLIRIVDNFVDTDKEILFSLLTDNSKIEEIKVAKIKQDNILKIRQKYDEEKINELIAKLRAGYDLPPIILVRTPNGELLLADGYYRLLAHLRCYRPLIRAVITNGKFDDVLRLRLLANADHPTPLSPEEKRQNTRSFLLKNWRWSDPIVAFYCGGSSRTIAGVRKEMLADSSLASAKLAQIKDRLFIRGGKMYEMKVAGINENRDKESRMQEETEEETLANAQIINNEIKVRPGEVFLFFSEDMAFPHIIYNGDGRCRKFRKIVFATRKAGLLIIDLPYNVNYISGASFNKKAPDKFNTIPNDNLSLGDYHELVDTTFLSSGETLLPGSVYVVWCGRKGYAMVDSLCSLRLGESVDDIIWVKKGLRQSKAKLKRGYEKALFGWTGEGLRFWNGGNALTNVFDDNVLEQSGRKLPRNTHPTPKSVTVYRRLIEIFLEKDGIVFDPMMGSGTTVYAAHLAGRVGVGIELMPEYTAVAVSRMLDLQLQYIRTTLDKLPEILSKFGSNDKSVVVE